MVLVRITTAVRPTEEPERVREAVVRLFPDADVKATQESISATTNDLGPLRRRIWELRIIDTFRGQFLHGATEQGKGRSTGFRLSKQAALAGKVSFAPMPHPLGDLDVRVELERGDPWPDIERLAFWLCPETKDGEIVGPSE